MLFKSDTKKTNLPVTAIKHNNSKISTNLPVTTKNNLPVNTTNSQLKQEINKNDVLVPLKLDSEQQQTKIRSPLIPTIQHQKSRIASINNSKVKIKITEITAENKNDYNLTQIDVKKDQKDMFLKEKQQENNIIKKQQMNNKEQQQNDVKKEQFLQKLQQQKKLKEQEKQQEQQQNDQEQQQKLHQQKEKNVEFIQKQQKYIQEEQQKTTKLKQQSLKFQILAPSKIATTQNSHVNTSITNTTTTKTDSLSSINENDKKKEHKSLNKNEKLLSLKKNVSFFFLNQNLMNLRKKYNNFFGIFFLCFSN